MFFKYLPSPAETRYGLAIAVSHAYSENGPKHIISKCTFYKSKVKFSNTYRASFRLKLNCFRKDFVKTVPLFIISPSESCPLLL